MIIYSGTAKEFSEAIETNQIVPILENSFTKSLGRRIPPNEISAYTNSLPHMERVLRRSGIPDDCGVLVEYLIPLTSNRIDFVITGQDDLGNKNFIIIELKQWQDVEATDSDSIVRTYVGQGVRETTHPSYQAYSYKLFLSDFSENISNGDVTTYACAYMHNYVQKDPEPLLGEPYTNVVKKAPLYFRDDQLKLEEFVAKYVNKGKGMDILYEVESGKVKPSKKLIDHLDGLFKGNQEFVLLDEQKVAFEKCLKEAKDLNNKSVVIINGGPGTGKSVLSVNLLGELLKNELNTLFVAPNATFRNSLVAMLAKDNSKMRVKNLFQGSGKFVKSEVNEFDALIVDEAHRLKNNKAYMYFGENQVEDIIEAANTAIFFIDDDQAVRPEDIGSVAEIKNIANRMGIDIHEVELTAQFRCAGAEGYINWLNDAWQIKQTGNFDGWSDKDFEFKIFENPNEMRKAIKAKSEEGFKARILAGYAWKWSSEKEGNRDGEIEDVEIPEFSFSMPWNSRKIGTTWAIDQNGIDQVGCIHTSQGLEFDYVGIIVGNDITFDFGDMNYKADYNSYKDANGKKGLKEKPEELSLLIRRIY